MELECRDGCNLTGRDGTCQRLSRSDVGFAPVPHGAERGLGRRSRRSDDHGSRDDRLAPKMIMEVSLIALIALTAQAARRGPSVSPPELASWTIFREKASKSSHVKVVATCHRVLASCLPPLTRGARHSTSRLRCDARRSCMHSISGHVWWKDGTNLTP